MVICLYHAFAAPSSGNMTWAAMLQRGDGGAGPVPQAAPPASKVHLGSGSAKINSVVPESKPLEMTTGSQSAQPQRGPR